MLDIDPFFPFAIALPDAEGETNRLWSIGWFTKLFVYWLKKEFQKSKMK
jgi:hypothetical protein